MSRTRVTVALAILAAASFLAACGGDSDPTIVGPSTVPPTTTDGTSAGNAILRVRCEVTSGRSKISVDGNHLAAGAYRASVRSGGNTASSEARTTVRDEVEFDFDSNLDDIAAGATAIGPVFIQGGRAEAALSTASGRVIASSGASCS